MSRQYHQDELAVRFLLDQLAEEDRSAIEERFFKDDAVFEDLEIVEEELIERYLDNRLKVNDRVTFEELIAKSPRLRERLAFARIFANKVDESKPAVVIDPQPGPGWWERLLGSAILQRPAYKMALVAPLLIVVLGGVAWMVTQSRFENQRLEAQRLHEEQQKREEAERRAKLGNEQQPSPAPIPTDTPSKSVESVRVATLVLFPGGSRSVEGATSGLIIESDQQNVRLTLTLEDSSYSNYVVRFQGMQTRKNLTKTVAQRKNSNTILVELVGVELPTDDYMIKVDGINSDGSHESVSNYSLRVTRK